MSSLLIVMRKTLSRIIGILLATTLLVGVLPVMPTTASLEVPSMEDVIIAQANINVNLIQHETFSKFEIGYDNSSFRLISAKKSAA